MAFHRNANRETGSVEPLGRPVSEADDGGYLPPLIPPGDQYIVQTRKAYRTKQFGRRILIVDCEIIGGEFDGARTFWTAALPPDGRRPGVGSKFLTTWIMVVGRRPQRGERPAIELLVGKRFRVRIETVTRTNDSSLRLVPRPPAAHYSVVRDLLERIA
jgi:hypothetical protein